MKPNQREIFNSFSAVFAMNDKKENFSWIIAPGKLPPRVIPPENYPQIFPTSEINPGKN